MYDDQQRNRQVKQTKKLGRKNVPHELSKKTGRLFWTGGVDITEYRTYRALVR